MQLHGKIACIGDWMLVKWGMGKGVKLDLDKRCRVCGVSPQPGGFAWVSFHQPYVYCQWCFDIQRGM